MRAICVLPGSRGHLAQDLPLSRRQVRFAAKLPVAAGVQLGDVRACQREHRLLSFGEVGAALIAEEQEASVGASERCHRHQDLVLHTQRAERRTQRGVCVGTGARHLRMMKQRGVVAGGQRAGAAVLLPELLPEQLW